MTTLQYTLVYFATVPIFFAIDLVWLGVIAKDFYRTHLGHLMGDVQWIPAIIFYLIYIVGIVLFAVSPAIQARSLLLALGLGALFGFIAYATYDLTNLATLKDWPVLVTVVDLIWGSVLTSSVATLSYLVAVRFIV